MYGFTVRRDDVVREGRGVAVVMRALFAVLIVSVAAAAATFALY